MTLEALRNLGGRAHRGAIADEALRIGGFTDRELDQPAPPRSATHYTRLVDYQVSWALSKLKADGVLANPERGVWELATAPAGTTSPADANGATAEWHEVTGAALARAGHACEVDPGHTGRLEVRVLCEDCHQRLHEPAAPVDRPRRLRRVFAG